jgi:hypothetical protein
MCNDEEGCVDPEECCPACREWLSSD